MTLPSKYMSSDLVKSCLKSITQLNDFPLEVKANEFCQGYRNLPFEEKIGILKELACKHDFDKEATKKAAEIYYSNDKNTGAQLKAAEKLKITLQPNYANALNRIRKLNGGVKFIVDLREDLLKILPTLDFKDDADYHLKSLNNYLKEILSFSFNIGFLNLERITWDSSCTMLEKISQYEAVHPVRNWTDIKQRVGPYRRCYIFTHNSMPKEPIVVLHTALTNDISSSVASIMHQHRQLSKNENLTPKSEIVIENPKNIHAAIFYSITSTQKGLHGIELGNQLIKKAVQEVLSEFPHISMFSSLSPIPGFRDWLLLEIHKLRKGTSIISMFFSEHEISTMRGIFSTSDSSEIWNKLSQAIASNDWIKNGFLQNCLKIPFMKICVHYLFREKRRSNALNSVAHFHLRNGAVLWRLNWEADVSPRGLNNSCGMMVNYRYFLEETENNSKRYIENHDIAISEGIQQLLQVPFTKSSL